MGEINGGQRRYEQDRAQIENIIRRGKALRAQYLQINFWPAFGATGGVLMFFMAAVMVPP
jgi:hypothetical protein